MTKEPDSESDWTGFDGTFEGTRRRQLLAGLTLTPAERLRWLETWMTELLKLKGAATATHPSARDSDLPPTS
jgi:hypothetical protein